MSVSCKKMAEAIQDMRTVCDFTENGKCSGCGSCCGRILPLSAADIKRIKKYLDRHPRIKPYEPRLPLAGQGQTLNMICPFLDQSAGKRKCMIYEARPTICREYMCSNPLDSGYMIAIVKKFRHEPEICDMWKVFFGRTDLPETFYPMILGTGGKNEAVWI